MTKYDVLQNKSADLGQFASQCTGHSYFGTASLHSVSFKRLAKVDLHVHSSVAKGQLISKCPFGVIVWTKISTKNLTNFCPRI